MVKQRDWEEQLQAGDFDDVWTTYPKTYMSGSYQLSACVTQWTGPIGTIWFSLADRTTIYINDCYVPVRFRRCGIMTMLMDTLLAHYPKMTRVVTGVGSKDGGAAWLRSYGFRQSTRSGDWIHRVPRRRKKQAA